jgi:hypothetical protein
VRVLCTFQRQLNTRVSDLYIFAGSAKSVNRISIELDMIILIINISISITQSLCGTFDCLSSKTL